METGDEDASSNRRIEMLRVRLEQYNAAIAEAMGVVNGGDPPQPEPAPKATMASPAGGPRLVPPTFHPPHQQHPPPANPATVERSLISELLAAAASRGPSEGRKSSSCEVTTESAASEATASAQVHDVDDETDDDAHEPAVQLQPVTVAELESSFHSVNAVEQSLKIVSSFASVAPQLSNSDKLAVICGVRDNLLRDLKEATVHTDTSKSSGYWAEERDVQTMVTQLMDQCTEAQRHFALVYEKKAAIYAKEKILENRAAEMQRCHATLQAKRQSISAQEASLEHRKHAIARREEDYRIRREEHRRREDRARQEIATVEKLGEKVASWMKILESRDDELVAKEQRLRSVQVDLSRRAQEVLTLRDLPHRK